MSREPHSRSQAPRAAGALIATPSSTPAGCDPRPGGDHSAVCFHPGTGWEGRSQYSRSPSRPGLGSQDDRRHVRGPTPRCGKAPARSAANLSRRVRQAGRTPDICHFEERHQGICFGRSWTSRTTRATRWPSQGGSVAFPVRGIAVATPDYRHQLLGRATRA